MKCPDKGLDCLLSCIEHTREMAHNSDAMTLPFLGCKILNVNVVRVCGWFMHIDHHNH